MIRDYRDLRDRRDASRQQRVAPDPKQKKRLPAKLRSMRGLVEARNAAKETDKAKETIDYDDAVCWISKNDAPDDEADLGTLTVYPTVAMVAALFDREVRKVAADVLADREFRRPL